MATKLRKPQAVEPKSVKKTLKNKEWLRVDIHTQKMRTYSLGFFALSVNI